MEKCKSFICDASCPIGIFDSGLGGLTVQKEVILQLPHEDTVYFGDSGRMPYGTKSRETILSFAKQDTRFLLEQKVKMIVIACNTASAHAYKEIAAAVDVPVVEVISPGALAAVSATKNGRIGVIGTTATVESKIYVEAILNAAKTIGLPEEIEVFQQACPLFVSLAEEGWWDNEVAFLTAKAYLSSLKEKRGRYPCPRLHTLPAASEDHREGHGPRRYTDQFCKRGGKDHRCSPERTVAGESGREEASGNPVFFHQ